jgi:hypothetical protein
MTEIMCFFVWPLLAGLLAVNIVYWSKTRPKVYTMESDKWIFVKDQDIPEGDCWVTDGKIVRHCARPDYNKEGKPILFHTETEIIAWMPKPLPPRIK